MARQLEAAEELARSWPIGQDSQASVAAGTTGKLR